MPGQVTHFYTAARIALDFPVDPSDDVMPSVRKGIGDWISANHTFTKSAWAANAAKNSDQLDDAVKAYRETVVGKKAEDIALFSAFAAGAIGPDLWTIPSGIGDALNFLGPLNGAWYFDMGHYNSSHVFPAYTLWLIKSHTGDWPALQRRYRTAYILGYITHICTDILCHPLVNVFARAYFQQKDPSWELDESWIWIDKFNDHNKIEHYWDALVRYLCFEGYHQEVQSLLPVRETYFGQKDHWDFPNYEDYWEKQLNSKTNDLSGEDKRFLESSTSLAGPFAQLFSADDERKAEYFIRKFFYDAYDKTDEYISKDHEGSLHEDNVENEEEKLEFFFIEPGWSWVVTQKGYLRGAIPSLKKTVSRSPQFYDISVLGRFISATIPLGVSYVKKALAYLKSGTEDDLYFLHNWNLDIGSAIRIKEFDDDGDPKKTVPVCIDLVNVFDDDALAGNSIHQLDTAVWKARFPKVSPPWTPPSAAALPSTAGPSATKALPAKKPATVQMKPATPVMLRMKQVCFYTKDPSPDPELPEQDEIDARLFGSNNRYKEPWVFRGSDDEKAAVDAYKIADCVEDFLTTGDNANQKNGTTAGKDSRLFTSSFLGGTGEFYIAEGDSPDDPKKYYVNNAQRPMPRHLRVSWCRKWSCVPDGSNEFLPEKHKRHHTVFPSEEMAFSVFSLLQKSADEYLDLFFGVTFSNDQLESLKHIKVVGVNSIVLLFKANAEGTVRIYEAWVDGQKQIIKKEKKSEQKPPEPKPPEPKPPETKPQRVRLIGMSFDTSKSFILPDAMTGIKGMVDVYNNYPESELLIVGHTDTAGTPDYNDPLSLERADAVSAYLRDDVDAWLDWYDAKHPYDKRWGKTEDTHMLKSMADYDDFSKDSHGVVWGYQKARGLSTDNDCGPNTRRQLITDYMAKDGTSLPKGVEVTTHGCGESFPQDPTPDGTPDPDNRRVELFLFPKSTGGIQPPPPGKISKPGSTEYPQWVEQTPDPKDFTTGEPLVDDLTGDINMQLYDAEEYTELAGVAYTISGDDWNGSGTTDSEGKLKHKDIPFGDYTLSVTGRSETCAALVLDHSRDEPQVRFL